MQRIYGTVTDGLRAIPGASVAVYIAGTSTLATIYDAADGPDSTVAVANPMTADGLGRWICVVPQGYYTVKAAPGLGPAYEIPYYHAVEPTVVAWGDITGTLANQTDLESRLNTLAPKSSPSFTDIQAIGSLTDYTQFEADGSMLMVGLATTFDDLSMSSLNLQQQGTGVANNPTEAMTEFTNTANLSDYIYTSTQMPHAWLIGSTIRPHLHWMQTTNATPNWLLEYRWQPNGGSKTVAWTRLAMNTPVFTYVSGTLHNIAKLAAGVVPPVGAGLSDILQFKIYRDNANTSGKFAGADPVAATAGILSFDVHIERDRLGSRQEYTK